MILKRQKPIYLNSILFLLSTFSFLVVYLFYSQKNTDKELLKLQQYVTDQEGKINWTLHQLSAQKETASFEDIAKFASEETFVYVYRNDTLVHWNSNSQKVSLLLDKYIDGISLQKYQNGWYLTGTATKKNITYRVSHKIYNDYPIQNAYLINGFSDNPYTQLSYSPTFDSEIGYPIYSAKGAYLFSLQPNGQNKINPYQEFYIVGLLFLSIATFLRLVFLYIQPLKPFAQLLIWSTILFFRWYSLKENWMVAFKDYTIFQANLFGVDFLAPNLFEFLVSLIVFFGTCSLILKLAVKRFKSTYLSFFIYRLFSLLVWAVLAHYISAFVFHSTIPLATADLFQMNLYSTLAILTIGGICLFYYQLSEYIQTQKNKSGLAGQVLLFSTWIVVSTLLLKTHWSLALYPVILVLLLPLFQLNAKFHSALSYLIFGIASSTIIALAIQHLNTQKELDNRHFFANQLFSERDFSSELNMNSIDSLLKTDKSLHYFFRTDTPFNATRFDEYLDKKYFNSIANNYDFGFFLFDSLNHNMSNATDPSTQLYIDFMTIIDLHGDRSEITPSMYFVHDHIAHFSYIIKSEIWNGEQKLGTLVCTLKSKKNPEAIGFPKLLIPNSTDKQALMSHYSFAKFHENVLAYQHGDFEYPYLASEMDEWNKGNKKTFDYNGYNHSIYKSSDENVVIVSVKLNTFFELTTSISFFFCCFLLLMVITNFPLILSELKHINWNRLATKIQVAIVCLTILTLVITTWGAGSFFSKQFEKMANEQIQEKTNSVEQDLRSALGRMTDIPSLKDYSSLNAQLRRLCRIHKTDINLYNNLGHLVATSRLQLYSSGLLSEQMNPKAYIEITEKSLNHFLHQENIGRLNYSSSYMPINNFKGEKLGVLNLQFFGQQENSLAQMNELYATLINIFLFVFVVSTILTVIVGSWITSPLRQLHNSLNSLKFGKNMSRLKYDKRDEIGDLVEDYNKKLLELEETATQLAKSERESAWRDMAKQVAHEIKNPLTPMKLSVQHLQRSINPDDPQLMNKINRVSNSLIEQIDALTKIANEFSNFAKMPAPKMESLEIVSLIKGVLSLFENESDTELIYEGVDEINVLGDKDQLLRVINNLVKNSLQAINHTDGKIKICTKKTSNTLHITVDDNGSGIAPEQIDKMFVPYFTTKNTGTGLGLSMVKQIIENHGGTIRFETKLNEGTCFFITLPVA